MFVSLVVPEIWLLITDPDRCGLDVLPSVPRCFGKGADLPDLVVVVAELVLLLVVFRLE